MADKKPADERQGLPSASGLSRVGLCPGSWAMEKNAPPEPVSPLAERGTRIHARMEGLDEELSPEEELVAREMMDFDGVLFGRATIIREIRLWYKWDDKEELFSGKLDAFCVEDEAGDGVLVNYKTGRGQQSAYGNWQAMAESLLFFKYYGKPGMKVKYHFVQPESIFGKVVLAVFTEEDLALFERKILKAISDSKADDPQLRPSEEACRWCKAVSICPAANWRVSDATDVTNKTLVELDGPSRAAVLDKTKAAASMADKIWKSRQAEARALLADDSASIPGYGTRRGRAITKISNSQLAYEAAKELGVSDKDFFSSCNVSYSKFEKVVLDKVKAPNPSNFMEDRFGGVTSRAFAADNLLKK